MSKKIDAGIATAYGAYLRGGGEMTYEEFCAALADLGVVLEDLENLSVTCETLAAGSSATVSYADGVIHFGIPKGDKGDKGDKGNTGNTPNISIGTVTTGAAGSSAAATMTGTADNPVLNLTIPQGVAGEMTAASVAPVYSSSVTYAVGDYCTHDGQLYRCTTAISTAEAWTAAHWTAAAMAEDVTQLKSEIEELDISYTDSLGWVLGAISSANGTESTSTTRMRTQYLQKSLKVITAHSGYKFIIAAYNGDSYVGMWNGTSYSTSATWLTGSVDIAPMLSSYNIRLIAAKSDDSNLTISTDYAGIVFSCITDASLSMSGKAADAKATGERIGELGAIVYAKNLWNGKSTANKIINASGVVTDSTGYDLTDFYEVSGGGYLAVTRSMSASTRGFIEYSATAFFDKNKKFIVRNSGDAKTVPVNAKYARTNILSTYNASGYKVMIEKCNSTGSDISSVYVPFAEPFYLPTGNWLYGKKICAFGDSLAAADDGDRTAITWVDYVAQRFGATAYNRGIGTSCVTDETSEGDARTGYAYVDSYGDAGQIRTVYNTQKTFADYPNEIAPWMCNSERANTIPTDTDVVIIIAGTNDVGTTTVEGFKTAYATMLDNIITRVPNAKVFPCTLPFQQSYDLSTPDVYNSYRTAIKEVAALYGFECIDLRSEMGVNAQNYSTYMNDATHFNKAAGRKRTAETIIKHLKDVVII